MGRFILKPVKDKDLYVEWSTVVDAPVGFGTREQMLTLRVAEFGTSQKEATIAALDRADQFGSSVQGDGPEPHGGWTDEEMILMNGPGSPGMLPRENLLELINLYDEPNADELAKALVQPFPDDE